ncbi:TIR domain-containing protein [Methylobacter tundripaludum]|uniref:TIR domain-containing protein n=1 Tax=Methylobacter tundripaludum TaxID=173365 RepID=A0A2S6H933_9GAMM|nr:toll/interleukin-1 receptor domain-containing protein [Methylobacter tundripaludum]PPK73913.1 TIR domain-containing protein [Methylobacter tundripaludum]
MISNDLDHIPNDRETESLRQQTARCDAFICYSRQDSAFAEELLAGLAKLGRNVSIDRHDIRGGEAWQRKLGSLIQNADNVIFLISSASLASSYCRWELDYAGELNKRLINVVVNPDNLHEVPTSISTIQYINADGTLTPDMVSPEVVTAIETDQDWAEYHTQLALRAQAWKVQEAGLLRGFELKLAESQMLKYQGRRPFVTELQSTLLLESQQAARRRFRWAALALTGVTLSAAFGINTWIGSGHEEARRLLGETRNYFVSGDQIGAVLPLDKLAHPSPAMGLVQDRSIKRSGKNLFNAWVSRLVPLQEIIDRAPANSLLSLNDHPVLKLPSRTLKALDPKGDFRLAYSPFLSAYIYADASHLSVHEPETFKPLLTVTLEERAQIVGIYPIEPLKMVLVAAERRQVTNDEDEPNSISTDIYVVVRKSDPLGGILCRGEDSSTPTTEESNLCSPANAQPLTGGFTVFSTSQSENYRIESVAVSSGETPFVRITSKLDCDFKDECESNAMLDITHIYRDSQSGKKNSAVKSSKTQTTQAIASSSIPTTSSFPETRPEASFWRLQNSPSQAAGQPVNSLTKLDYSRIADKDDGSFYAQFFEEGFDPNNPGPGMFSVGNEHVVWREAPGGNSWTMVVKCHYQSGGLVTACSNDMGLTIIDAELMSSPGSRYLAHRVCSSTEPSLSVYDMVRLDTQSLPLEIPATLVLGFAFNPSATRLTVLTDQHELWSYAITPDGSVQREKIMTLPGKRIPINCDTFYGHPIAYADDQTVIGVDQGSVLFAANVEHGEILWTSKGQNIPAGLLEQAQQLQVNAAAGIFLLNSSNILAMFDTGTGLPISDAIDTAEWKKALDSKSSTEDIQIEKVAIEPIGQISVGPLSFDNQFFIRNNPTGNQSSWPSECMPLEMLTGLDANGRRMNANDLLGMYLKTKDCGK